MNILEHRKEIDSLDQKIVQLLNERTTHVLEIGSIKKKAGEEIYAPHREVAVLRRLCRRNKGPITNDSLKAIYREIMSSALSLEKTMTISYLGPEATFTHQAAIQRFGASLKYNAQKTVADVFSDVSRNRADYGVVPVENSTEGVVTHTLDMFVESDLKIVAQIVLPIRFCLVGSCKMNEIQRLYAHPQAVGQCRFWIQNNLPKAELIETSSNARSAEIVAQAVHRKGGQRPRIAAITGFLAAEKYDVNVIACDIQDLTTNATRFLVLGRQCSPATGHDRTSVMLSISDEVGALYRSLAPFRKYKLNMTKIESRPSKRKAWEYFFFVDCDGHMNDPKVAKALTNLSEVCNFVKVLGSYPNAE